MKIADVTSQIDTALSRISSGGIMIPQPAEVRGYLLRYPDIIDLLMSVCKIARERFEMHTQLSLEVYHDPEIDDEYPTLYVRQENYDEQILDKIESICVEYEKAIAGKSGWLLVTTDFQLMR